LVGTGFSRRDKFIFSGGVEAKAIVEEEGGGIGRVTVLVPKDAQSGPITIRHTIGPNTVREGQSRPFTVLGPPTIEALVPDKGPVGTAVLLTVRNVSNGSFVFVRFGNADTDEDYLRGSRIGLTVPVSVTNQVPQGHHHDHVAVTRGQAQRNFTVLQVARSAARSMSAGSQSVRARAICLR
jgi:hypothetical protein